MWVSCVQAQDAEIRVVGRHFVDRQGRVVILRGINLAGDAKKPPFLPIRSPRDLDPLPELGFNVVRLVVPWEALEPRPGSYDHAYIGQLRGIVSEIARRGMFVILDLHQDGFSRYLSHGKGDGFPSWAISPHAHLHNPADGPCHFWPLFVAADPGMHRSFTEFYADTFGVRTRYLAMLGKLAHSFASESAVIGYDVLNEPWGDERTELFPLHRDAAEAIRAHHPTAILFLEGHINTNIGFQTRLPAPEFGNVVYAPHYYKPSTFLTGVWIGETATIDRAFRKMNAKVQEWDVPLFLGEFGASAETLRAGDYVARLYDKLDETLASGTQWNYTPGWTPQKKDGWNGEDFNILEPGTSKLRTNFRSRPYPRQTAGEPLGFRFVEGDPKGRAASVDFLWNHDPAKLVTEMFIPRTLLDAEVTWTITPADATWSYDPASQILRVRSSREGLSRIRMESTKPRPAN